MIDHVSYELRDESTLTLSQSEALHLWNYAMDLAHTLGPKILTTNQRPTEAQRQNIVKASAASLQLAARFPLHVQDRLLEFGPDGNREGAFLVRFGPPPDEVRLIVPKTRSVPSTEAAVAGGLLTAAFAYLLDGKPLCYTTYPGGPLVHSAAPIEDSTRLAGRLDSGMHAELSASILRPDYVVLNCLRAQFPSHLIPVNTIVPAENILSKLSSKTIDVLSEPRFLADNGMVKGSKTTPAPLIMFVPQGAVIKPVIVVGNDTKPVDESDLIATQARDRLLQVIADPSIATRVQLLTGDVLLFDQRGAHSRSTIVPAGGLPRMCFRTYAGTNDYHMAEPQQIFVDPLGQVPQRFDVAAYRAQQAALEPVAAGRVACI